MPRSKLLARIKSLFRKPSRLVPAVTSVKRKGLSIGAFDNLMAQIGKGGPGALLELPRNKFKYPELPEGVRPLKAAIKYELKLCMDSAGGNEPDYMAWDDGGQNIPSFGFLNTSPFFGEVSLTFPGFAFLAQLQQISEYRAPSEVTSTEMTREWIKVVSKSKGAEDKTDKIAQITERMEKLKLQEKFQTVTLYDGQFGGGFLYWQFKSEESDEKRQLPKMVDQIQKDSIVAVSCIEPYWCTPFSYNADRPEREDFYVPLSWFVMGRKTHASRLMIVRSRPVPDLLKPSYNFMGISLTQLMFPYIQRWLRTAKSVNDLINIFSIVNLKTNLAATLEDDGTNGASLLQRLKLFTATRDNRGVFATDKDDEELEILNVALATLDKLQAQAQEHMAAPCHIPLIKLFGAVPTGLNATGEGEIQVWYDWVAAQQSHALGDHVNRALEIIQMDLFGAIDDDISYEWVPLFQPTPKEQSELNKTEADRDTAYITAGVISPDEARAKLQSDPTSGYDGLTGDAPEPPQDVDADGNPIDPDADPDTSEADSAAQAAEHEHASGEADKDRKHEASEGDKDRANALKLAAKKKQAAK